jgi:uncharacterized membrane protein YkvA (DUF1232 family)
MPIPRWKKAILEAEQTVQDRGRTNSLLERVFARFKVFRRMFFLGFVLRQLGRIAALVKAWVKGDYRAVSTKTVVTAIAALIYFINPLDLIPDWIPVIGLLDEALVLAWVTKSLGRELDEFEQWNNSQTTKANPEISL